MARPIKVIDQENENKKEREEKDVIFTVTRAWDKFSAQNVHIFKMHDKITIKKLSFCCVFCCSVHTFDDMKINP